MFVRQKLLIIVLNNFVITPNISCSNLLHPSGVMLRPATFSLKVYKAEDIPQSKYYKFAVNLFVCDLDFLEDI